MPPAVLITCVAYCEGGREARALCAVVTDKPDERFGTHRHVNGSLGVTAHLVY